MLKIFRVIPFFFALVFVPLSYSAQIAYVQVDKAIIYADVDMKAPIGYAGLGKKIKIGEAQLNNRQLYTVAIGSKIAYIKVEDVITQKQKDVYGMSVESKRKKEIAKDSSVAFGPITRLERLFYQEGYTKMKRDVFLLVGGTFVHEVTNPRTREVKKASITYLQGKKLSQQFSELDISFEFGKRFYITDLTYLKPRIGVTLVPFAQYEVINKFSANGYGVGGSIGLDLQKKFNDKYSLTLGTSYLYHYYTGFKLPYPYPDTFSPTLNGYEGSLVLAYHF